MTTPSATGTGLPMLVHALYDSAATLTGLVGLTPLQVVEGAAALFGALILWNLGKSIFNKQGWTLDPARTPAQIVVLDELPATSQGGGGSAETADSGSPARWG